MALGPNLDWLSSRHKIHFFLLSRFPIKPPLICCPLQLVCPISRGVSPPPGPGPAVLSLYLQCCHNWRMTVQQSFSILASQSDWKYDSCEVWQSDHWQSYRVAADCLNLWNCDKIQFWTVQSMNTIKHDTPNVYINLSDSCDCDQTCLMWESVPDWHPFKFSDRNGELLT